MTKANENIRKAARTAGIPLWRIAAAIGVSEPTMCRWLRFPLSADREQSIMQAIVELSKEAVG